MSEIDDKEFLGGYKNSNQKRDGALSQGVASIEFAGHKSGKVVGDGVQQFDDEAHLMFDSNTNENLNVISSPNK